MLKISHRNCTLKVSEKRGTGLFLNSEKSKSRSPGPITELRPESPSKLEHVPAIGALGKLNGRHCEAMSGVAAGRVKQFRLRYCSLSSLKFELTALQFGMRSGNA